MTAEQHNLARILALRDDFRRRDTHVVSITIARGGSRRIPRKNAQPFAGRPLVEWSILQSRCSHLITEVYLCTDDEEMADIGRRAGAKIIWRYEASPEGVTGAVTFAHAIRQVREYQPVDIMVGILPTNPLRQPWDLDENIRLYWETRKQHRDCYAMGGLVPQLETIIHERIDGLRSTVIYGDKSTRCLDGAGSAWSVADPDWYLQMAKDSPLFDRDIDKQLVEVSKRATQVGREKVAQKDVTYYYQLEHFQRYDLDLPEQLPLMEDVMRRYILTTPDVFERYKAKEEA